MLSWPSSRHRRPAELRAPPRRQISQNPRAQERPELVVVRRDVRIAAARRHRALRPQVPTIERREEIAPRHAAHAQREIGREARTARVGGVTRRALRLEHAPADVDREVGAARLVRRAIDSIRPPFVERRLRRADREVERSAKRQYPKEAAQLASSE